MSVSFDMKFILLCELLFWHSLKLELCVCARARVRTCVCVGGEFLVSRLESFRKRIHVFNKYNLFTFHLKCFRIQRSCTVIPSR